MITDDKTLYAMYVILIPWDAFEGLAMITDLTLK